MASSSDSLLYLQVDAYIRTLNCKGYSLTSKLGKAQKEIAVRHITNKLQVWLDPGIAWQQQKSFSLHFLALFLVLTSYSSRLLSQLGQLASSSRFLSYSFAILMEGKGLCLVIATKCLG